MKKSGVMALTGAAVVVLGGAAAGGYALSSASEPVETPVAVASATPEPSETATAEPAPSQPASAITATPEAPQLDGDAAFVQYAGQFLRGAGMDVSDAEVLSAGEYACQELAAGSTWSDIAPIEGATDHVNGTVVKTAEEYLCD